MIVNLTPHTLHIHGHGDQKFMIPASGIVARCEQKNVFVKHIKFAGEDIPVFKSEFGAVKNLPEPKEGVLYVVSKIVAEAIKGTRDDILIPGPAIKDEGKTIGADGFCVL